MYLRFNTKLAENYHSKSQIIRVLSESWVQENGYCPLCGTEPLKDFANNQPVADFYCQSCEEQYELKSKQAKFSKIITDGAYDTMIERINSDDNPNFFFLTYSKQYEVNNFLIIPKHFFTPKIIIKRKPLSPTSRRAGWVGCNIDLSKVPENGKVFLVKNQEPVQREKVITNFNKTLFLRQQTLETRGWLLDVLKCVDKLPEKFTLKEIYQFTETLSKLYPHNNNVQAKIRQQLQLLRDKGLIEFVSRGSYRKI
ncbi:MAG: restriction endonuclease [Gammaproteobacteria bacterium]|nr:MAG: restriction endonuclease [Gammaproteobacteria bacterium]